MVINFEQFKKDALEAIETSKPPAKKLPEKNVPKINMEQNERADWYKKWEEEKEKKEERFQGFSAKK